MRYFWLIAPAILVSSCGSRQNAGTEVDSAFRPYIDPNSQALVDVNVARVRESNLYKRHEHELPLNSLEGSAERLGIDPRRDVSNLLVDWSTGAPVALLRGNFDATRIGQKTAGVGVQNRIYNGAHVLDSGGFSVLFTKEIAIAAPSNQLMASVDRGARKEGRIPDALYGRLRDVPREAQIWAVTTGTLPLAKMPVGSDAQSVLSNIVGFINGSTTAIRLDDGAHLQMALSCISEQGAVRVNDALRGTIGFARLSTKSDEPDVLRLYDAIKVSRDGQAVHVTADLNSDLADRAIRMLSQARNQRSRR